MINLLSAFRVDLGSFGPPVLNQYQNVHVDFVTTGLSYLVEEFLQETVQPGLSHLHGPGLVGYVAHFDQNHHELQARQEALRYRIMGIQSAMGLKIVMRAFIARSSLSRVLVTTQKAFILGLSL